MWTKWVLLGLHVLGLVVACACVVMSFVLESRSLSEGGGYGGMLTDGVLVSSSVAFLAGLASMALRKGKDESYLLAATTVLAPVLPWGLAYVLRLLFR
ncbi:MAG TPA: hypothetical protein VGJ04_05705 [Pirellulales bacterium]|jgi:hypothetical protein